MTPPIFPSLSRRFAAPPEAVYRAHVEPELIQKWMLGPEGVTMPVCISEARPGGRIRFEWTMPGGGGFYLTGEYLALEPYRRMWAAHLDDRRAEQLAFQNESPMKSAIVRAREQVRQMVRREPDAEQVNEEMRLLT